MPNTVAAPQSPKLSDPILVTSTSFAADAVIPARHAFKGCGGENVSPQLSWRNAPKDTRGFVVTCFDPDAPTGSGFWHWLLWGIPGTVMSLAEGVGKNSSPLAGTVSGYTDYGLSHYGGPCPPPGDTAHRYVFTVYALDVPTLSGADAMTTGARVVFSMRGHLLAQGSLTGKYGRSG